MSRLVNWLSPEEEEQAITDFITFLRFETVSGLGPLNGSYDACAAWLVGILSSIGLENVVILPESDDHKPVVVASWLGSQPELPAILLNSHYDVVPVIEEHWTVPAFEGFRKDSRIYGRGAQDMKCVCIQYITAIRKLKALGFQPVRTIHLSFVPDEETGGNGMNSLLRSSWYKGIEIGLALDEGLASEDNEFSVFYGERLPWWVKVTAEGNTGHGSRFIEGTAVEQIMAVTQRALAFRQEQKDILHGTGNGNHENCSHAVMKKMRAKKSIGDVTSLNVTLLRAGMQAGGEDVMNVVPAKAEVGFDIRISPHIPPKQIADTIDTWCQEVTASTTGLPKGGGLSWEYTVERNPLKTHNLTATDDTNPWWVLFEGTLREECGVSVKTEVFPAATDSRFLRALGVRALGFSPMRNSPILLHEHDEYLDESVFVEGCNVYATLIRGLARQGAF